MKTLLKKSTICLSILVLFSGCFGSYSTKRCVLFKGKKTGKIYAGCHDYHVGNDGIGRTSPTKLRNIESMTGAICTTPENAAKDNAKMREAWRYCKDNNCF